ncbi:MAG: metal-sulfur cluster assembly factor [Roseovarius sp.]|nr:metal-sulfur cluster assembly factor [Roseovarius sp.]
MDPLSDEALRDALRDVFDPELGYNIVDLGMIYGLSVDDGKIDVTMTLTTPGCPASEMIQGGVVQRLMDVEGVKGVAIDLGLGAARSPDVMSPAAKEHFGIGY